MLARPEDDMSLPLERKIFVLQQFHEYIFEKGWNFTECKQRRHHEQ